MNTSLSSLPSPSFADLALRGEGAPRPAYEPAVDDAATQLHASPSAGARAIDAIERDFLAALCENHG
jgi:hypothetical protein